MSDEQLDALPQDLSLLQMAGVQFRIVTTPNSARPDIKVQDG